MEFIHNEGSNGKILSNNSCNKVIMILSYYYKLPLNASTYLCRHSSTTNQAFTLVVSGVKPYNKLNEPKYLFCHCRYINQQSTQNK